MEVTCPHCGGETRVPTVLDATLKTDKLDASIQCDWCEREFDMEIEVDIVDVDVVPGTEQR